MQCKKELSSGARCMYIYIERVTEILTPQCARSVSGVAGSAGKSADTVRGS